jgi:hypothetical protein
MTNSEDDARVRHTTGGYVQLEDEANGSARAARETPDASTSPGTTQRGMTGLKDITVAVILLSRFRGAFQSTSAFEESTTENPEQQEYTDVHEASRRHAYPGS